MLRKKLCDKNKLAAEGRDRRRALLIFALLVSLITAGGALAQWASIFAPSRDHNKNKNGGVAAESLSPGSPSKEYVYAGSRLIATEEPASTTGCNYSISPTSQSLTSTGGSGTVAVSAGAGCSWSASSNAAWLRITSGATGSGSGSVGYSADANPGAQRTGAMTIAGQTFTVSQSAGSSSCSYTLSTTNVQVAVGGGSIGITVSAGAGCNWSAQSNASWLTIQSGGSGSGNGLVTISIAANSGPARAGTVTIAGQIVNFNQDGGGSSCSYSISPTSGALGAGGGQGSVNLTTGASCNWTAQSNATWLTITSGSSGTGNGTVNYQAAANTGAARTGTLTIAGQTFTLNQSATGAPPAPTLTATALSATSIRIDWTFTPDGISIFKIERKTGTTGTYAQFTSAEPGTRTYIDTKRVTHTTYCYRVRAYNGQDGPYSNEACAATP